MVALAVPWKSSTEAETLHDPSRTTGTFIYLFFKRFSVNHFIPPRQILGLLFLKSPGLELDFPPGAVSPTRSPQSVWSVTVERKSKTVSLPVLSRPQAKRTGSCWSHVHAQRLISPSAVKSQPKSYRLVDRHFYFPNFFSVPIWQKHSAEKAPRVFVFFFVFFLFFGGRERRRPRSSET